MIVDDVEHHHQPALMRRVDQRLEVVGPAIGAVRCVPQHAVIAPVARAGEIGQRHQFQCGDAGIYQMIEPFDHRAIGAFLGEGADMGLEDHGLLPRSSVPVSGAPWIGFVIDHLARAKHVIRLKRRRGIRYVNLVIDAEFIARARFYAGNVGREQAVLAAYHRMRLHEHDVDAFRRRRPQPKLRSVTCQARPELPVIHAAPANASTDRGGALVSVPAAKSMGLCTASTVFSTCCQLLYSGISGNLKPISSGAAFRTIKIGG